MSNAIPALIKTLLFNDVIIHIPTDAVRSPCFQLVLVGLNAVLQSISIRLSLTTVWQGSLQMLTHSQGPRGHAGPQLIRGWTQSAS